MGCHVFFQGIFSTHGSNPRLLSLLYCRRILCLEPLRKPIHLYQFSSVSSVAQSCPTLCYPMNRSTPGLPVHHKLPEFTQTHAIESVMPSSLLILCRPLLLLPPIPPSIRVFSHESALRMRWPKYWSFNFSISPSSEHPGLTY